MNEGLKQRLRLTERHNPSVMLLVCDLLDAMKFQTKLLRRQWNRNALDITEVDAGHRNPTNMLLHPPLD